jgi:hypothetical protein
MLGPAGVGGWRRPRARSGVTVSLRSCRCPAPRTRQPFLPTSEACRGRAGGHDVAEAKNIMPKNIARKMDVDPVDRILEGLDGGSMQFRAGSAWLLT